jgi:hypothetical protein
MPGKLCQEFTLTTVERHEAVGNGVGATNDKKSKASLGLGPNP